jgi:4-amino-4-deoxy-L-arabinose transferase-like glycosyltransferase
MCWFAIKPIFPKSDPLVYFTFAKRILNHEYVFSHSVQSHRYGVFIPQAIFINLFGENPYVINLWTLLCSITTIFILYCFLLKYINRIIAVISGVLLSVNLIQIIYSSVVFPDIIVSLFALCCVYFIYRGRQEQQSWLKNSLFFIMCFAFGFTAKESIGLVLPFVAFIFWKDWRKNNFLDFQKSSIMFLILFLLSVFVISKIITDDFIFFYKSYSYYTLYLPIHNFTDFLKQISYEQIIWFNSQLGYIFIFIFSIPAFINGIIKKDRFSSPESFISLYLIILFLSLWCGSISVFHLGYIPLVDRRWMTLIAPLCILSAISIHKIILNSSSRRSLYFLVSAFFVIGVLNSVEVSIIRGALFFVFAATLFAQDIIGKKIKDNYRIRTALILLPFFILAIQFLKTNSNYVVSPN